MNLTKLIWTFRSPWDGVFENITPDQEEFLLCELNLSSPEDRRVALSRIIWILHEYEAWVMLSPSIPDEVRRAENAVLALRTAVDALNELSADRGYGILSWKDLREEYIYEFDGTVAGDLRYKDLPGIMSLLSDFLIDFADERRQGRGRPSNDGLDKAIYDLALLYEEATGRIAGYSAPPDKVHATGRQAQHGPFVRFCKNVISVVTPTETSTVENAIRKFVEQAKKSAEER